MSYSALVTLKYKWWTFALIMAMSIVFVALFFPEALLIEFQKDTCSSSQVQALPNLS